MRALACLFVALQATFSVRTEMVVLPVTVSDARGHSVAGLAETDFRVYDEGRLQPITFFRGGDVPITIGLVVDHSQSMGLKLAAVNAAAVAFARSGRAGDELFVVTFSDRVRTLPLGGQLFTSDPAVLDGALVAEPPGGRTALYDAVAEALRHLTSGRSDRKALVVVTDGGDNASHLKYRGVRDLARESQAVIYGIGLIGAEFQDENPEILKRLCRDSGGVAYFPGAPRDVAGAFVEIARDMREQYTLGFVPGAAKSGKAFHTVKVTALGPTGNRLRVRTRSGYSMRPPP